MTRSGRFVRVAGTEYKHHPELGAARVEVEKLRALLAEALQVEVLENPDLNAVRTALESLEGSVPDDGPLVLFWAGHAVEAGAEGLRLLTREDGSISWPASLDFTERPDRSPHSRAGCSGPASSHSASRSRSPETPSSLGREAHRRR